MPRKMKNAEEMEISFIEPPEGDEGGIPEQKEHFQLPTRFGTVPGNPHPLSQMRTELMWEGKYDE